MSTFPADLERAISSHEEDYRCDIPVHPERSFVGWETVRGNWAGILAHVPEMTAGCCDPHLTRRVVVAPVEGDQAAHENFCLDSVDQHGWGGR